MADEVNVRWGLAQRFEFIEWRAYWVGRVNRKDLEDAFHISTPQASIDFKRYQEAAPGNIEYNATEKTYVATDAFRPKFLALSPERYMLQLQAVTSGALRKSDTWFDELPRADVIPTITRGAEAYTLRAIIQTIKNGEAIKIYYRSLERVGLRTICPHALAHDGYRWHARALSLERQEYRDYVLGRILSVSQPEPCNAHPTDDVEWETFVKLRVIAHPGLTSEQKATIEHDYRLKDGKLDIEMRAALAFYFIRRHNLDLRISDISPERAQLFLENFGEVKAAVEEAKQRSKMLIAARGSAASPPS
ncbi:MAG: WYL domain-containing protein [Betaproteobacteria bacterium]|nr:MAG: WYL domain-containing protein [Betaproteobacteria bacterium]